MLQAETQFRQIVGYSDLAKLVIAIARRHLVDKAPNDAERPVTAAAGELATV